MYTHSCRSLLCPCLGRAHSKYSIAADSARIHESSVQGSFLSGSDMVSTCSLTYIHKVATCRHPSTASFLMSKGSNPCVADREGAKMAIHYACLYGHWSCAQVMMETRWVVQNSDGLRPLAQVRRSKFASAWNLSICVRNDPLRCYITM